MELTERMEDADWINVAQDADRWWDEIFTLPRS